MSLQSLTTLRPRSATVSGVHASLLQFIATQEANNNYLETLQSMVSGATGADEGKSLAIDSSGAVTLQDARDRVRFEDVLTGTPKTDPGTATREISLGSTGAASLNFTGKVSGSDQFKVRMSGNTGTSALFSVQDADIVSLGGTAIQISSTTNTTISNAIINNLTFPASDGNAGDAIVTDGSGALSFGTVKQFSSASGTDSYTYAYTPITGSIAVAEDYDPGGGTSATATFTFSGTATLNSEIEILNTAGAQRTYQFKDSVTSGQADGTDGDGHPRILVLRGSSASNSASELKTAIEHANGHNGTIAVTANSSAGVVLLTQSVGGVASNTTVTLDQTSGVDFTTNTSPNPPATFTGGAAYDGVPTSGYGFVGNVSGLGHHADSSTGTLFLQAQSKYVLRSTVETGSIPVLQLGSDISAAAADYIFVKPSIGDSTAFGSSITVSSVMEGAIFYDSNLHTLHYVDNAVLKTIATTADTAGKFSTSASENLEGILTLEPSADTSRAATNPDLKFADAAGHGFYAKSGEINSAKKSVSWYDSVLADNVFEMWEEGISGSDKTSKGFSPSLYFGSSGSLPSKPGYSFTGDADTGMYLSVVGTLSFTAAGTNVASVTSSAGWDFNGKKLTNIDTSSPAAADVITKSYVDAIISAGTTVNTIPRYDSTSSKWVENTKAFLTSSGILQLGATGTQVVKPKLTLTDGVTAYTTSIQSHNPLSASITLTLPSTDGNANDVITSDGSGVLGFVTLGSVGDSRYAQLAAADFTAGVNLLNGTKLAPSVTFASSLSGFYYDDTIESSTGDTDPNYRSGGLVFQNAAKEITATIGEHRGIDDTIWRGVFGGTKEAPLMITEPRNGPVYTFRGHDDTGIGFDHVYAVDSNTGGTRATATFTFSGQATLNSEIEVIDASGAQRTYQFKGSVTSGTQDGTDGDGHPRILVNRGATASNCATELKFAMEHANGHNGSILVTANSSAGVVLMAQASAEAAGNTTITLDQTSGVDFTTNTNPNPPAAFTGGVDGGSSTSDVMAHQDALMFYIGDDSVPVAMLLEDRLEMMYGVKVTGLPTPTGTTDAVNKLYVDTLVNAIISPETAGTAAGQLLTNDVTSGTPEFDSKATILNNVLTLGTTTDTNEGKIRLTTHYSYVDIQAPTSSIDGVAATATFTFSGQATVNSEIELISADGTQRTYQFKGSVTSGTADGTDGDGHPRILVNQGADASACATELKTAVEHANGHGALKIGVTANSSAGVVLLTQYVEGSGGNTTITLDQTSGVDFTTNTNPNPPAAFTGGVTEDIAGYTLTLPEEVGATNEVLTASDAAGTLTFSSRGAYSVTQRFVANLTQTAQTFAARYGMTLTIGSSPNLAPAATESGFSSSATSTGVTDIAIGSSLPNFNAHHEISVKINGVAQIKGHTVIWVSSTSCLLRSRLKDGDVIEVTGLSGSDQTSLGY